MCHKIKEHWDQELSKFIGHKVWVIGGNKKGSWATLYSVGRRTSCVTLFGHQMIQLRNHQISMLWVYLPTHANTASNTHPRTDLLLNGTILPSHGLWALVPLYNQSFKPIVEPSYSATPPPAPSDTLKAPWAIMPDNITSACVAPWWVPGDPISDIPTPPTTSETTDYGMIHCHLHWILLNLCRECSVALWLHLLWFHVSSLGVQCQCRVCSSFSRQTSHVDCKSQSFLGWRWTCTFWFCLCYDDRS